MLHAIPHVSESRLIALRHKNLFALFLYQDSRAKEIVWEIKYRKNVALAEKVGELLYREMMRVVSQNELSGWTGTPEKIILAPVPTSRWRKRNRGFSQCECLCKAIMNCAEVARTTNDASEFFIYQQKLLTKIKETPRQEGLARAERLRNVVDSFGVTESERETVRGNIIFVIDDVVTTGATLTEIQKVLYKAGAKKVCGFAVTG